MGGHCGLPQRSPKIRYFEKGLSGFGPEEQVVLHPEGDPARLFEPGQVGLHRAAHQKMLLDGHGEPQPDEKLPEDMLKGGACSAELTEQAGNLLHLLDVDPGQGGDIGGCGGVGGHDAPGLQRPHLLQCLNLPGNILEER